MFAAKITVVFSLVLPVCPIDFFRPLEYNVFCEILKFP